jgi:hypothetical protein
MSEKGKNLQKCIIFQGLVLPLLLIPGGPSMGCQKSEENVEDCPANF